MRADDSGAAPGRKTSTEISGFAASGHDGPNLLRESDADPGEAAVSRPVVWMADWSDAEDGDFRAACDAVGVAVEVIRSVPLGTTVGRPIHRFRSYPRYVSLALRGTVRASGG